MADLKEAVRQLEDRVEALKQRVARLRDRNEIANLMGKYNYLHATMHDIQITKELWAQTRDDVTSERSGDGLFVGLESVKKFHYECEGAMPGQLILSANNTPMIEVAADGLTAKAVWQGIGPEGGGIIAGPPDIGSAVGQENGPGGFPYGEVEITDPDTGKPMIFPDIPMVESPYGTIFADWMWMKYGIDFIKENGQWRIWHFHSYEYFRCPVTLNWVDYAKYRKYSDAKARSVRAPSDFPPTFHWLYLPDAEPVLQPAPPEPYGTFSETFAY